MRILYLIIGFLSVSCNLLAQIDFTKSVEVSSGISMYSIPMTELLHYKAFSYESFPIDLMANIEYKPVKRVGISAGMGMGYEKLNLFYADFVKVDSIVATGERIERVFNSYENEIMINERSDMFTLNVPLSLKFYVSKRMFIAGSITSRFNINSRSYRFVQMDKGLGVGANYARWGWTISVAEPWSMSGIKMLNNTHPSEEYQDYLVYKQRSLKVGLHYNLSDKKISDR